MMPYRRAQYLMGTTIEVVVHADEPLASVASAFAFDELERIERVFNIHDPDSELSAVNRNAARSAVHVSKTVFDVVTRALELSESSGGDFSIALGPMMALWKQAGETGRFPTDLELGEALDRSDFRHVRTDASARSIAFVREGMRLDLGGIVKGYAVDRARDALVRSGISRAMISAGESSLSVFEGPDDDPWRVGVRHPADEERIVGVLELSSTGVSTSGTYERGVVVNGRPLSHVIDPRTGLPLEGAVGATAVCPSAELAEVVSTMLLLRGCQEAIAVCDRNGWEAEGVTVRSIDRAAGVQVEQTSGFALRVCS